MKVKQVMSRWFVRSKQGTFEIVDTEGEDPRLERVTVTHEAVPGEVTQRERAAITKAFSSD